MCQTRAPIVPVVGIRRHDDAVGGEHPGRAVWSLTIASGRNRSKGDSKMSMLHGSNRRQLLKGAIGTAGVLALGSRTMGDTRAQTVKLVNVEHDSRPLDNAAYQAVYEVFREQHPDIEIDFQVIPWEQARQKMLTLAQANTLPDMGRNEWGSDYAAADMIVPLDDLVNEETLSRFDPLSLEYGSAVGNDGQR